METATRQERKTQKKGKKSFALIALLVIILIAGAAIGAKVYIDGILDRPGFYAGISIDGLDLEGKSKEDAIAMLSSKNQSRLDEIQISLNYKEQEWKFGYQDIGAALNTQELVDKAYKVGREGNFINRLKEIRQVEKNGYNEKTAISYNADLLKDKLSEIKSKVDEKVVDATVKFNPGASSKFSYTDEKKGYVLDDQKLLQDISEGLNAGWNVERKLEPQVVEPKILKAQLQKATKQIAHFSTDLGSSTEARRHNIALSISKFNGMVVQPGDIISFNETTGPRSEAKGYKNAPVIKADKSLEDGPGGGVCQSSTTLYNAILLAGLEVKQRSKHSFPSSYVDTGFDATVNWPNLDMKFQNNRDLPLFIQSYVSGNRVHVIIYGEPLENGRTIKLVSDVYETLPAPEPTIKKDTTGQYAVYTDEKHEKIKSRKGIKVKTYRITYENGKEVSRQVLANDYYKPIKGLTYVGVKKRETAPATTAVVPQT